MDSAQLSCITVTANWLTILHCPIFMSYVVRKATQIKDESSHPLHSPFSHQTGDIKLHCLGRIFVKKKSFIPTAVTALNNKTNSLS